MDISETMRSFESAASVDSSGSEDDLPVFFVAPLPAVLPNDGFVKFIPVVQLSDFSALEDRSCGCFPIECLPILSFGSEYPSLVRGRMIRLDGIPEADYSVEFDSATWRMHRVSYPALLSELAMALDVQKQLKAREATAYDRERAQVLRADGSVKEANQFDLYESTSGDDSGGEVDDKPEA